jgi:hypothetical protein
MTQPLMTCRKPDQGRWLRLTGVGMSLALVCCLVALTPMGVTLELHHALGAEDTDGHEHSDSDLCQWGWLPARITSSTICTRRFVSR